MKRRDFIALVGAAVAGPLAAHAQPADRVRRIGVLSNGAATDPQQQLYVAAFEQVLRSLGWRIGENLRVDYRWGAGNPERINAYAAELVAQAPDLIAACTTASLTAVLRATRTIPVVFASVSDPVVQDFVASLAHPGGNATGFSAYEFAIGTKWLDLLKQLAPGLAHVGMMFNPLNSPQSKFFLGSLQAAAPSFGVGVTALPVHQQADIEPAIATLARRPAGGLIIGTNNFLAVNRKEVVVLAARHRLPAIYGQRDFVQAGGLISYSYDTVESYRGAAFYVDRVLEGAKPGDLPVQMGTKFALAINLKAVQALGLELPMSLTLLADEVIE